MKKKISIFRTEPKYVISTEVKMFTRHRMHLNITFQTSAESKCPLADFFQLSHMFTLHCKSICFISLLQCQVPTILCLTDGHQQQGPHTQAQYGGQQAHRISQPSHDSHAPITEGMKDGIVKLYEEHIGCGS